MNWLDWSWNSEAHDWKSRCEEWLELVLGRMCLSSLKSQRRWVDNVQNDPLMTHSISDELERWRTNEGLSQEQITKSDRSRIRYYVVSAERFLEAKLRKHGLRFETIGSYHNQTRRLTQPLDLAKTDMILTETQQGDTPEPITSQ